jgi:hypothetical protein
MNTRAARVTAAYATVKIRDNISGKLTVVGFHGGAILPADCDADNVAMLVRRGYAEWVDEAPADAVEEAAPDEAAPAKSAAKAAKAVPAKAGS